MLGGTTEMTWAVFLLLLAPLLAWRVKAALPITLVIVFGLWAIMSGRYEEYALIDQIAFKQMAGLQTLVFVILILVAINSALCHLLLRFFFGYFMFSCLYIIYNRIFLGVGAFNSTGLLGNASMVSCTLAVLLPLVFENLRRNFINGKLTCIIYGIFWIAIFCSGSSLGIGLAALSTSGLMVIHAKTKIFAIIGIYGLAGAIGYVLLGGSLFHSSSRDIIYELSMKWWDQNANVWVGLGPGTTTILLPYIQKINDWSESYLYIYMHSDWLQILFEHGVLGLISALGLFFYLIHRSRHNPYLTLSIVTYGIFMICNFPMRLPLTALLGAVLVGIIPTESEVLE